MGHESDGIAICVLQNRCDRLERLVIVLARGILLHEYSKDLCRYDTEEILKLMCNEMDLHAAESLL